MHNSFPWRYLSVSKDVRLEILFFLKNTMNLKTCRVGPLTTLVFFEQFHRMYYSWMCLSLFIRACVPLDEYIPLNANVDSYGDNRTFYCVWIKKKLKKLNQDSELSTCQKGKTLVTTSTCLKVKHAVDFSTTNTLKYLFSKRQVICHNNYLSIFLSPPL